MVKFKVPHASLQLSRPVLGFKVQVLCFQGLQEERQILRPLLVEEKKEVAVYLCDMDLRSMHGHPHVPGSSRCFYAPMLV